MAASDIDPALWHAIAGSSTLIPWVNSNVYYFPQGHIYNSSLNGDIYDMCPPPMLCRVLSVRYLCTHSTDQPFLNFLLFPIHQSMGNKNSCASKVTDHNDIVYFSKVLTASDANNGGGFSVPRFCADSIFPRLNFTHDPPVQTLKMFDAHQNEYEFRHIYRGTPRRHLLTTGWSKFVNDKRLVAGDSVVFMKKKSTGRIFIGTRRLRSACSEGFREDRFREEIENARRGMAFDVVYYPRMGKADFVVNAEKVEESMGREWKVGMRVKMVAETEDSSRISWFQGIIESVDGVDDNGSPWGIIQVNWDEHEILQINKRVSPWQIECVVPFEEEHHSSSVPLSKKLKAPITLTKEDDDFSFPELTHSTSTFNWGTFRYPPVSVSMPGAGLDAVSNSHTGNSFGSFTQLLKSGLDTEPRPVSTVLNLGCNAPPAYSFQLFGQTIHMSSQGSTENISCGNGERSGVREEMNGFNK